jgi:hypothetical protein
MSLIRFIFLLLSYFILISPIRSQTADEIIQKHIEAIGGYEKIKAIKKITFEGTNKSSTIETSFKSYIIHDSAACTEGVINGKPSKGVATKKTGWICTDSPKNPFEKKDKYQVKQDQKAMDIHGPLVDYIQKGNKVNYLGTEKIKDTLCYKIKLKKADKSAYIYYFDSSTFLIKRIISLWPIGNQREFTYDYTYKTFDSGYSFVIRSVRLEDGYISNYSNYIINPEIDVSIFIPCK